MLKVMPNKNYKQLQFSNAEEEMLINLVKENPPLYGIKNKSFKDIELKENLWKKIAQELNKSVSDCKIKWKHIRDYYQRQRREGKKGTGSAAGSGSGDRYDSLQFLKASFVERQTKTNVHTKKRNRMDVEREQESQDLQSPVTERYDGSEDMYRDEQMQLDFQESSQLECQQKQHDLVSQHEDDSDNTDQIEDGDDSRQLSSPQNSRVVEKAIRNISSQSPPKKLTPKRKILKEIQKGRKERLDLFRNLKKNFKSQSPHPIDLFFHSMAAVVKTFPPRLMLEARSKVCNIIGELELQALMDQEAKNAVPQFFHTWPIPTEGTFSQSPSPTYSTHSSSSVLTTQPIQHISHQGQTHSKHKLN